MLTAGIVQCTDGRYERTFLHPFQGIWHLPLVDGDGRALCLLLENLGVSPPLRWEALDGKIVDGAERPVRLARVVSYVSVPLGTPGWFDSGQLERLSTMTAAFEGGSISKQRMLRNGGMLHPEASVALRAAALVP